MVTTCIYRGLARGKMDRLYLFCLPFGYVGVFLLLHFGTDLSVGLVCERNRGTPYLFLPFTWEIKGVRLPQKECIFR